MDELVIKKIPSNHPSKSKVGPKNEGPFIITEVLTPLTYMIRNREDGKMPFKAHNSQLLRYERKEKTETREETEPEVNKKSKRKN